MAKMNREMPAKQNAENIKIWKQVGYRAFRPRYGMGDGPQRHPFSHLKSFQTFPPACLVYHVPFSSRTLNWRFEHN